MNPEDTKDQNGGAIFAALTAFKSMRDREQPENSERDDSGWDEPKSATPDAELGRAYAEAAEEMKADPLLDLYLIMDCRPVRKRIGKPALHVSAAV